MIGQSVLHYKILEKLGEGGMGIVYKAHDSKLDRVVALKFLPSHVSDSDSERARLMQEARAAASLNHPNVCTIHSIEDDGEHTFIVMELVDGRTLRKHIASGPMAIDDCLTFAIQAGEALQEAHLRGIIHRDIKSDNIMVTAKGQLKVMDFGLAKLKGSMRQTKTTSTVGTLGYMAPEQISKGQTDVRSDIFSFGVVLFELLTGHLPFRGDHDAAMMYSILNEDPESVERYRPEVSPVLSNLIQRSLEKDPNDRYQSIADIVIELRRLRKQSSKVSRAIRIPEPPPASVPSGHPGSITGSPASTAGSAASILARFRWPAFGAILILAAAAYLLFFRQAAKRSFDQMKISRLTNTGTVQQAAISPDGHYVVYSASEGGKQRVFMRQTAVQSIVQLVPPSEVLYAKFLYSRDGNSIYSLRADRFGSLSDLALMPALGGTMRRVLENVDDFTLSPDGSRIAFIRYVAGEATYRLVVAREDGSGEVVIYSSRVPRPLRCVAWSPSGKEIIVGIIDANALSIAAISPDGGTPKTISSQQWADIRQLDWISDGSGIVALPADELTSSGSQLWLVPFPSGDASRITNDINSYTSFSMARDSRTLVATVEERHSSVSLVPRANGSKPGWDAEHEKKLTTGADDGMQGTALIPDGRIVYAAMTDGTTQLWIMDPDGRNARQLTTGSDPSVNPVVSPDGQTIVFLRSGGRTADLWKMGLDGREPTALTHGDFAFAPSFTGDGSSIVFSRARNGKYFLWKIPLAGGEPVQITDTHTHTSSVSPDGTLLATEYQDNEKGTDHDLAILPIDGGKPIHRLKGPEHSKLVWAPDGRSLVLIEYIDGVNNLWSLPLDGSKRTPMTRFASGIIFDYSISRDAKTLAIARGPRSTDVVLIGEFR